MLTTHPDVLEAIYTEFVVVLSRLRLVSVIQIRTPTHSVNSTKKFGKIGKDEEMNANVYVLYQPLAHRKYPERNA